MTQVRAARIPELRTDPDVAVRNGSVAELARFLDNHRSIAVLTGAGCSTGSGIPAYRDESGRWRRRQPIFYQDFINDPVMRRRYWARSYFGWSVMRQARPGRTHTALATLAESGKTAGLITQNVDGLHQRAGHDALIELHGGLERVLCLDCGRGSSRDALQQRLERLNPDWAPEVLGINPDGDAELDVRHDKRAYPGFRIAACTGCGGTLKPDVVFFGESVPRQRLAEADRRVEGADAMLIVGTSLVVWSGFRLARLAAERGLPIVAINNGLTRADALLEFKLQGDCGEVLEQAVGSIRPPSAQGPSV
ncbi:MAG: NAD-dependent protein deacetylase [Wenzhouxiangellaceae bacterium]|nr:NAD-dependent protein deacetylase [Wenzhouxiangellaceae bacterium]